MQEMMVQAVAAVVAGVVIFITSSVILDGSEASVSGTQFRTNTENTIDLVSMIKRDFRNIGANYPNYPLMPEMAIRTYDTLGTPRVFEFVAQIERGMAPDTLRYQWEPVGTTKIDGETVTTYRIERYVQGLLSGTSTGSVTHFRIELAKADGSPILFPDETRQIAVEVRTLSSLGASHIGETSWQDVIHPMHLSRNDGMPPP